MVVIESIIRTSFFLVQTAIVFLLSHWQLIHIYVIFFCISHSFFFDIFFFPLFSCLPFFLFILLCSLSFFLFFLLCSLSIFFHVLLFIFSGNVETIFLSIFPSPSLDLYQSHTRTRKLLLTLSIIYSAYEHGGNAMRNRYPDASCQL